MVEYFRRLHYPYENMTADQVQSVKEEVNRIANESIFRRIDGNDFLSATSDWQFVGPYGMRSPGSPYTIYSGRVLAIETSSGEMRVLSASGNLWHYLNLGLFLIPVSISDHLNTPWANTFVTSPTDPATIFIGTGEPRIHAGTGLWKTTDLGDSWTNIPMSPTPSAFYKIFYDPLNSSIMHTATDDGYFKSVNGGNSWTRYLTGRTTDLVIDPLNPQNLYTVIWGDQIYKSTNGGINWTPLAGGAPTTDVGRTALALCAADPNIIYACVTSDTGNFTKHIYKTINAGVTWDTCHIGLNIYGQQTTDFHWGQGWYGNTMTVSPTDCNLAFAGGGSIWRTTNGYNFEEPAANQHVDQHTFLWDATGNILYNGSDGGIYYTDDLGSSWKYNAYNLLPITQFYNFDSGETDPRSIIAGSQDNMVDIINSGQAYWSCKIGGDGFGVAIDPNNEANQYAIMNQTRHASFDNGITWNGINGSVGDGLIIRTDHSNPTKLYTTTFNLIYESTNQGGTWNTITPIGGLPGNVYDIAFSTGTSPSIYAPLYSGFLSHLWVRDAITNTWVQRDAGLPTNSPIEKVIPDKTQPYVAYAIVGGYNAGNKIFKTTDRGITWINISGNMPDVPIADLVIYPYNPSLIYAATEEGGFKTIDGGVNWVRWNNGLPESVFMTEMKGIDSVATNGKYYVRCSTFGRGIWQREISGDDITGIQSNSYQIMNLSIPFYNLQEETITFDYFVPELSNVKISIFDMFGREIETIANNLMQHGDYHVKEQINNLSSGIYFCRMILNNNFSKVQKFVVTK